jgi:arsenate reductase
MAGKIYNVLFICTGNSARSIMAEALMNATGRGHFKAFSAGSHPTGKVNPLALKALAWPRLPTEGYRSKDWNEFAQLDSPSSTSCSRSATRRRARPIWPGQPVSAHWGVSDAAAFEGSEDENTRHFNDAALILKRRIDLMLALPLERLDAMSLQHELHEIGKAQKATS